MIILSACWAPSVRLSASSRMITLVWPGGRLTFFCANFFICYLTTSMPLSSEALSYFTASGVLSPSNYRTMQRTLEVFPTPGGPDNIMWGIEPWATQDLRVASWSRLPYTSLRVLGLYFSNQISFIWRLIIINQLIRKCINIKLNWWRCNWKSMGRRNVMSMKNMMKDD